MIKQDTELDTLEEDIRKLKNKYDQFFAGIQRVPPSQERRNVETSIYEIGKIKMRDNTRRFRYNQLLSRYNQYRELWGRRMREREEGPMDFKRRSAALAAPSDHPAPPPQPQPARVTSASPDPYVKMTSGANGEEVRRLYNEIERENQKLGKAAGITLDQLQTMVQKQSDVVRQKYSVDVVAFRVDVVDGKVKLKAKPVQK
ncbi:MAG: MXAN_5187 C-terminal domain-containing protein [Thermoanaerobaculia bacterium]